MMDERSFRPVKTTFDEAWRHSSWSQLIGLIFRLADRYAMARKGDLPEAQGERSGRCTGVSPTPPWQSGRLRLPANERTGGLLLKHTFAKGALGSCLS
jgi:hypothetical protein